MDTDLQQKYTNYLKIISSVFKNTYEEFLSTGYRPHIFCLTEYCTGLPAEHSKSPAILLEITTDALEYLDEDESSITIKVRFSGVPTVVTIAKIAILKIMAMENDSALFTINISPGIEIGDSDLINYIQNIYTSKTKVEAEPVKKPRPSHLTLVK